MTITIKYLIESINIGSVYCYIVLVVILSIIIRLILCFFKAKAISIGEAESDQYNVKLKGKGIKELYWQSFMSNSGDVRVDDHWLPLLIGAVELVVFPFFMANGFWTAIVSWIGIKALSTWGGKNTRTAYNRFLFGNVLTLLSAVFIAFFCIN